MKRIAKIILGGLASVVVLLILLLIGINLYLQSGDVQDRVRLATEQAFGSPVVVRRTLYTPWSGLTLSGLSVADPLIPDASMVEASRFSVKFELFPLFQKRFVISEVNLIDPVFQLQQSDDGLWVVQPPRPARPDRPPRPVTESTPVGDRPVAETPIGQALTTDQSNQPNASPAYTVELKKFTIREGSALLTDHRGRPVVRLKGVRVDGQMKPGGTIEGELWIDELSFADRLHPRKLRADFVQKGAEIAITDIKSALAGGAIRGEFFAVVPPRGHSQFDLQLKLNDIAVPELIEEAHGDGDGAEGILQGEFRLKGNPQKRSSFDGEGRFSLTDGRLKPLDFIQQIGKVLRIDELQMLDLQRADLRLDIRDEKILVDGLTLQTDNLIITAEGPIDFDGEMELDGRLLVNQKIQKQLRGLLNDNFTASENAGYKQVAFLIGGKISRPQTDLADRLLGSQVSKYLGGFLKGMFKTPKSSGKKEDKDDEKPESRAPTRDDSRDARNATAPAAPGRI